MATSKDMRAYQEWLMLCEQIKSATPALRENEKAKKKRISEHKDDFVKFAKHMFPHYMDSDFGWFHLKAAEAIKNDPKLFAVFEWPREHAKSVFVNVMIPLWLYARGELKGMITVSANADKASTLLSDLQAEFTSNRRWIEDFGDLAKMGDWREGAFATSDGVGFWAFGRGQSPRGTRKQAKRPNYIIIDDIDDKIIVRNQERVREIIDWILEDLYGAADIRSSRLIMAGNRIHQQSILAHMVGDIKPEDPKRKGLYHLKVFATEHPRTHTKAYPSDKRSRPAWKERYTKAMLKAKMEPMGYRASMREYYHEHHVDGLIFQPEWIKYIKPKDFKKYRGLVSYCDPSFKESVKNDYKAIITQATDGRDIIILDIWLKQTSTKAMVTKFYDLYELYGNHARYFMEANFLQDIILDEFTTEGDARGYQMPIRGDKRKKPNKEVRVENMSPLYERGFVYISEHIRKHPDTQQFIAQLLGFGGRMHDDGPDAQEGGLYYLQRQSRSSSALKHARAGKYNRSSNRD